MDERVSGGLLKSSQDPTFGKEESCLRNSLTIRKEGTLDSSGTTPVEALWKPFLGNFLCQESLD